MLASAESHFTAFVCGEGGEAFHSLIEAVRVLRLAEKSALAVDNGFLAAVDIARDQRTSHCGTFEVCVCHTLVPARKNEAMRVGNKWADVLLLSVITKPPCGGVTFDSLGVILLVITEDVENAGDVFRMKTLHRPEKLVDALLSHNSSDKEEADG